MRISGHKTRSIFDRYNIVSERDLHDAARKLDNYLREKQAPSGHTLGTLEAKTAEPANEINRNLLV